MQEAAVGTQLAFFVFILDSLSFRFNQLNVEVQRLTAGRRRGCPFIKDLHQVCRSEVTRYFVNRPKTFSKSLPEPSSK